MAELDCSRSIIATTSTTGSKNPAKNLNGSSIECWSDCAIKTHS